MGLKFERTDDLEKLFESFATEPKKSNNSKKESEKEKKSDEKKK